MANTLAFDVYGTLIDTNGVVTALQEWLGDTAPDFALSWRNKQLEYSFRRGLMRNYVDFAVCTSQALDFCCTYYDAEMTTQQKQALLNVYRVLPAFDDVDPALDALRTAGVPMYAFSNGSAAAVEDLLTNANIRDRFLGIVSADELKTFKPDPAIYAHFLQRSGSSATDTWLISANPFDVIGAISAGMQAVWLRRSAGAVFDPWGIQPTITLGSLSELAARFTAKHFER